MTKVSFPEASTGLLIYVLIKVNDFSGKPTVVNRIFSVNSATDRKNEPNIPSEFTSSN